VKSVDELFEAAKAGDYTPQQLAQCLKELATAVEYCVNTTKNQNKTIDSLTDNIQEFDDVLGEQSEEIQDTKRKIFLHFMNTSGNMVEDSIEYRGQEAMEIIPNQAVPMNIDELFSDFAEEIGIEPDHMTQKMVFTSPEESEAFFHAYQLLTHMNTTLDPQELYEFVKFLD
tara:strand:- start:70365 stop:70877 length:513 start_codon:yes stop_codon:yes gene_type:complete